MEKLVIIEVPFLEITKLKKLFHEFALGLDNLDSIKYMSSKPNSLVVGMLLNISKKSKKPISLDMAGNTFNQNDENSLKKGAQSMNLKEINLSHSNLPE